MKILCTGFTTRAINSSHLKYDYATSSLIMPTALASLGHTVEHRDVEPGEDLSSFDLAIITVGPSSSRACGNLAHSAHAFHAVKRVVLACDDWSIENAEKSTLGALQDPSKLWAFHDPKDKWPLEERTAIISMLRAVTESHELQMLAPMFPWGDRDVLQRTLTPRLVPWDPTPFVKLDLLAGLRTSRKRQWVLATLQGTPALPDLTWPVAKMGNKRAGQEYIPEREVFALYGESYGVLCPPYKTAGSGWWRVRFHGAAAMKTALWCSGDDRQYMGPSYNHTAAQIESLSDVELTALGEEQSAWFFKNTASLDDTRAALQRIAMGW